MHLLARDSGNAGDNPTSVEPRSDCWHGRASDRADPSTNKIENERYWTAFRAGDAENTSVFMG
jgi:hypothetical protein